MTEAKFIHRKATVENAIQNRSKLRDKSCQVTCFLQSTVSFPLSSSLIPNLILGCHRNVYFVFTLNNPMKYKQCFWYSSGFIIMIPPNDNNCHDKKNTPQQEFGECLQNQYGQTWQGRLGKSGGYCSLIQKKLL